MEEIEIVAGDTVEVSPEMLRAVIHLSIRARNLTIGLDRIMSEDPDEYSVEERAKNAELISYFNQNIERHQAELVELEEQ